MNPIFRFEQYTPPVLNENMLRAEWERRQTRLQTALLTLAGILFQAVIVLLGYAAIDWYPWLTILCFLYVVFSTTGGGILAIAYSRKGGQPS